MFLDVACDLLAAHYPPVRVPHQRPAVFHLLADSGPTTVAGGVMPVGIDSIDPIICTGALTEISQEGGK